MVFGNHFVISHMELIKLSNWHNPFYSEFVQNFYLIFLGKKLNS